MFWIVLRTGQPIRDRARWPMMNVEANEKSMSNRSMIYEGH
jgi:hypothetical protein